MVLTAPQKWSIAGNHVSAVSRSCVFPFANCEVKFLPHVDSLVVPRRQFLKVDWRHYRHVKLFHSSCWYIWKHAYGSLNLPTWVNQLVCRRIVQTSTCTELSKHTSVKITLSLSKLQHFKISLGRIVPVALRQMLLSLLNSSSVKYSDCIFTSHYMQEVCRLMSIKQSTFTAYHPPSIGWANWEVKQDIEGNVEAFLSVGSVLDDEHVDWVCNPSCWPDVKWSSG